MLIKPITKITHIFMKLTKKTIYFLTAILILNIFSQNVLAIGQMTKPIIIEDILRGQEFTDTLILVNSEDEEVAYGLISEGEIKDWVSFYNIEDKNLENAITEIKIPAKSNIEATVKFVLPNDLPNGQYIGEVVVTFTPWSDSETDGSSATVSQRVGRQVSITVTDEEITDFTTAVIPLEYDVKQNEALKIKFIYENNGNVFIKPDVQLKIFKDGESIFNAIFPYPENEEAVKPKTRKELALIEWQAGGQEDGIYRAELKIMLNGDVIQEEDFRFTIGYTKESASKFLAGVAFLGFGSVVRGWFVIGGFLLVIAGILIYINKQRRNEDYV